MKPASLCCPHCGCEFALKTEVIRTPPVAMKREWSPARFGLTEREIQIANLIVEGMRNREIAQELGLSYQGTKNRIQQIFDKIGCGNRTEMVAMVLLGSGEAESK